MVTTTPSSTSVTLSTPPPPPPLASNGTSSKEGLSGPAKAVIAVCVIAGSLLLICAILLFLRHRRRKNRHIRNGYERSRSPTPKTRNLKISEPWMKEAGDEELLPSNTPRKPQWETSSVASLLKPEPVFSRRDNHTITNESMHSLASPTTSQPTFTLQSGPAAPSKSPFPPPNPLTPSPPPAERIRYIERITTSSSNAAPSQRSRTRPDSKSNSSEGVIHIEGPTISEAAEPAQTSIPSNSKAPTPKPSPLLDLSRNNSTPQVSQKSHFSWTNNSISSPQSDNMLRLSIASSRSSIAKYRTVDSWVGIQTNRISEGTFQRYLEDEIHRNINEQLSPKLASVEEHSKAHLLNGEREFNYKRESKMDVTAFAIADMWSPDQVQVNSPKSRPTSRSRGSKNNTSRPTNARASDYMQHPGTKVILPRVSLVPSEVLQLHAAISGERKTSL